ncbi:MULTISPECIES: Hrp/hrc type III secretion system-Hrp elicitor/effector region-harpin/ elicitor of hypersensitivity reaction [Enterobacteriaceae]|uniref:Hrp/hrc type III secretion system-Hrp elicitor/effector region-harpin/ elicitor of hypersensitivity reaction n=1 Tax=Enterobacteriaceae TaxID=543 RepID=UPI000272A552|nr:Hrp/hrc type III secretion system-Hrp elicitor/effector region-harpin/ elicitor of hypersensitivity reaction [Enterobacter sp. Ag1]EJF29280.1 hrp/hrc Type III secretion system-Hrp elicitor/effector region-harpin/ elicitor of hypersensitivity reaction [Enterobacter sp. Ag1]
MSTIGNMLNLATALPQLALNATPEGMAANLLKNVGDQMVNDIASKLTNLLFSGGMNGNNNNTFMSPQSQGGASMGNTLAMSNMQQMLQQVLQQMGVNSQNSPFNSQAGAGNMNAFNSGMSNGLQSPSTGIGLVQLPLSTTSANSANSFNQLGNNMGSQLGSKMGLQALDDVKSDTSGLSLMGSGKVDGGSKETRAEIGKYMDQHPEIYGKPQSAGAGIPGLVHVGKGPSSWEDALKNSKPLSGDSLKAFQSAKNDLKTSMVGGSIPGSATAPGNGSSSLLVNADAQLFNGNIIKDAMKHHHGALMGLASAVLA